ncbi:GNAT family N-acetyltransferase [Yoonia sp. R2331]|uniref:GNAT family N-acetyltransferase n=1 Tax=Yoonia sp. R2331 TaxID=3237238 RepID=UPI0034E5C2B9
MTRPTWEKSATGAAHDRVVATTATLPRIETARLVLRAPRLADWASLEPIFTTERATHIGGPMTAEDAWLDFNQLVAGWVLRGHGALTITRRDDDDTPLGLVLLGHEFGDPQAELGWLLTTDAEGQGYATEAAAALRDWGFDLLGQAGFVSYIADGNATSVKVAARLGATRTGHHPQAQDVAIYGYGGAA